MRLKNNLVTVSLLCLVSGWMFSCSNDTATGPRLGGVLTFDPEMVNFSRSQGDDTKEISIKNNSGGELTIYSAEINKSYVTVNREFPVTLSDMESITLEIEFVYEDFDGVRKTKMKVSHSDTSHSPVEVDVLFPIKREVTQRTFNERDEWAVDYHPSHRRILIKRTNTSDYNIRKYTIGTLALGSDSVVSVHNSETELTPVAYSTDGSEILYYKDFNDSTSQIFSIPTNGGTPVALTDSSSRDIPVAYSPDGDQIIYHSDRSGNREIYLMNKNGSQVQRYTDHPAKDTPVGITSDGRFLIFNSERNSEVNNTNIYRLNADDGSGLFRLSDSEAEDEAVDLSPDGNRILFFSQRDGAREIYTMDISGNRVNQLTYNYLLDYPVAFHPEGTYILYFSRRQTNVDIYTISQSGMIETRITDDYGEDKPVKFIEDGELILFNTDRNGNYDVYTSPSFVY